MVKNITNLARLLNIAVTLARYDALFPLIQIGIAPWMLKTMGLIAWFFPKPHDLGTRQGQHLAAALTQLGPSFIKFGQSLATRSDLIGEEIAADLSALQDKLPPFSSAIARAAITHELGEPVETLYENFTDEPVAAASIAQVHFATTTEGAAVAVKVLRPGIEEAFAKDLALFAWIAEKVEQFRPDLRRLKPREVVKTFAGIVAIEMDLRLEAAAASELADNFAGDDTFKVPTIDWTRTGQRVLTLERINGIPIDERATLIQAGIDPEDVLQKAACAFFRQMFRDGFFHGDMHPGNLFVAPDGGLIAVDFGIMGRLDAPTRRYLGEMLLGFLDGDYARVADVHFRAGYIP
ncbi:MAG: 2-polyprenylphenol 6-hydroxylase, partial [Rhodospirillales bacterium]|nr:2-polyprenylphenol 6-hydroxylase [Rhodospirillales bacterium]